MSRVIEKAEGSPDQELLKKKTGHEHPLQHLQKAQETHEVESKVDRIESIIIAIVSSLSGMVLYQTQII